MPRPASVSTRPRQALVAVACGVLALAACNNRTGGVDRDRPPWDPVTPGTTTLTGADVVVDQNATAVARVVEARCARAEACNDIGAAGRFSTRGACVSMLSDDMKETFATPACSGGVNPKKLEECLLRIRAEDCKSPGAELERLRACGASELCFARGSAR